MEFAEFLESESESESEAEAWRGRGARPVKQPSSRSSFQPRPAPNAPQYVTQAQLEAALTRSDSKIKTIADGVSTVTARIGSLASAGKKEADERKKTLDTQGKDLNQKLQLLALLPVLSRPPSVDRAVVDVGPVGAPDLRTVTDPAGAPLPLLKRDNNSLSMLLPLLLVTGLGGAGGMGGSGDAGDSGMSMMMLALVLSMGNNN